MLAYSIPIFLIELSGFSTRKFTSHKEIHLFSLMYFHSCYTNNEKVFCVKCRDKLLKTIKEIIKNFI